MRKLISTAMAGIVMTGLCIGLSGCGEESSQKAQTTTTSPGGKTVETESKSVKQTGQNPPAPSKTP